MAFLLWTAEEDAIDLGSPFDLLSSFKELGEKLADNEEEYAELLGAPLTNEETLSEEYVQAIAEQAGRALEANEYSDHTKWLLEQIKGLGE